MGVDADGKCRRGIGDFCWKKTGARNRKKRNASGTMPKATTRKEAKKGVGGTNCGTRQDTKGVSDATKRFRLGLVWVLVLEGWAG